MDLDISNTKIKKMRVFPLKILVFSAKELSKENCMPSTKEKATYI
jgi:hypothetical protein